MEQIKKELRDEMKKALLKMPKETRARNAKKIHSRLFETMEWKSASTIGVTVSRGTEIDTYPIIEKAWAEGKAVAVPKCNAKDYSMEFRKLESWDQLEVVYFGLKEPIEEKTELFLPQQLDLLIVPGLVFDHDGYRVGFGGGFFDRYLERYNGPTVSLLHEIQLQKGTLPKESFDQPVYLLILPEKVHTTRQSGREA